MFKGLPIFGRRDDPGPRPSASGADFDAAVEALFEARMTAIRAAVQGRRAANLASAARQDSLSARAELEARAREDEAIIEMLEG